MANPITWQNIDAPRLNPESLMVNAGNTITSGLDRLTKLAQEKETQAALNDKLRADAVRKSLLDNVASATTVHDLDPLKQNVANAAGQVYNLSAADYLKAIADRQSAIQKENSTGVVAKATLAPDQSTLDSLTNTTIGNPEYDSEAISKAIAARSIGLKDSQLKDNQIESGKLGNDLTKVHIDGAKITNKEGNLRYQETLRKVTENKALGDAQTMAAEIIQSGKPRNEALAEFLQRAKGTAVAKSPEAIGAFHKLFDSYHQYTDEDKRNEEQAKKDAYFVPIEVDDGKGNKVQTTIYDRMNSHAAQEEGIAAKENLIPESFRKDSTMDRAVLIKGLQSDPTLKNDDITTFFDVTKEDIPGMVDEINNKYKLKPADAEALINATKNEQEKEMYRRLTSKDLPPEVIKYAIEASGKNDYDKKGKGEIDSVDPQNMVNQALQMYVQSKLAREGLKQERKNLESDKARTQRMLEEMNLGIEKRTRDSINNRISGKTDPLKLLDQ